MPRWDSSLVTHQCHQEWSQLMMTYYHRSSRRCIWEWIVTSNNNSGFTELTLYANFKSTSQKPHLNNTRHGFLTISDNFPFKNQHRCLVQTLEMHMLGHRHVGTCRQTWTSCSYKTLAYVWMIHLQNYPSSFQLVVVEIHFHTMMFMDLNVAIKYFQQIMTVKRRMGIVVACLVLKFC